MERAIHEMGIQKTFTLVHRQVWCWQDEWIELTLSDIRRLEAETAEFLKKLMSGELDSIPRLNIQSGAANVNMAERGDAKPVIFVSPEPVSVCMLDNQDVKSCLSAEIKTPPLNT